MAKRRAAQDDLLSAKRIPPQSSSADASRISVSSLALAGQAKYDFLQFDVGCTVTKGAHVIIVGCKVCHWHPPAGSISRTRAAVHA